MDNSDKQNAKFLGEVKEDYLLTLVKQSAQLPDEAMGCESDLRIRETARRHVLEYEQEIAYFIGTENGIADIESPPSDN